MDFNLFKSAVATQFAWMQKHQLFRVNIDNDDLWITYLNSFPAGSNPIYRERTEHDCACCRQFIRQIGNVVAIVDNKQVSVWDVAVNEPAYQEVAKSLAAVIATRPIAAPFLHYEQTAGTDRNFEQITSGIKTWTHFHVNLDKSYVAKKDSILTLLGEKRAQHDVLLRSLKEITDDALDTVLDLITQNSLYRGDEHKVAVLQFKTIKGAFQKLATDEERDRYAWTVETFGAVSRLRNTVIGTLLIDISNGLELENAVKAYEAKVAPANYKRPTALITKVMIDKAKEKLDELGLTSALERRFANLTDVSINNVLFANRSARKVVGGTVFDDLADQVGAKAKSFDKVEEIPIDHFLQDVLPRVQSLEALLENRHVGNLVSLIAPQDPTARLLFKWPNNFSWSYNGEMADAIKERVKRAGGNVTGELCCRLAWHNFDDLDLHLLEPTGGHIFFGNKRSPHGGMLDVDMNAGFGHTREPVENIFYIQRARMKEGKYHLYVNQYNRRESDNIGFEAEIDYLGTRYQFAHDKSLRSGENITVAIFEYTHANGLVLLESLPTTQAVRNIWSIPTQTFHHVNVLMLSPNYWDEKAVGNKHYFFMLDGCKNDGTARGFFNEFLKEDLTPHRKVFEVVAAKTKPQVTKDQLSGLGFSSTQRNTLICRVKGSFTRTIKVAF
jgi:hypothetical protein